MKKTSKVSVVEIHKEIDLIQSCINRMAQNSFMIKGWFVSIYAVVLALMPKKVDMQLLCITLIVVNLLFWYLDAFYLRMRKIYRKMYEWVLSARAHNNRELMYQLNPKLYQNKIDNTESIWKVMWSQTLRLFYLVPLIIVFVVLVSHISK